MSKAQTYLRVQRLGNAILTLTKEFQELQQELGPNKVPVPKRGLNKKTVLKAKYSEMFTPKKKAN